MTPILLFAFNRLDHLKATIDALKKNKGSADSELYVFCDGARNEAELSKVLAVQSYAKGIAGFKKLTVSINETNRGLANSVIIGVSKIFEKYEKIIVLEDDILTTTDFLQFMNHALSQYEASTNICSVSGYSFNPKIPKDYSSDIVLTQRASSWGWGTWKNKWQAVDWDLQDFESFIGNKSKTKAFKYGGEDLLPMLVKAKRGTIDSWAVRWTYHHFKTNSYCLVPRYSKVQNIGTDGSGTNFTNIQTKYEVDFQEHEFVLDQNPKKDDRILQSFKEAHRPSIYRKIVNYLKFRVW